MAHPTKAQAAYIRQRRADALRLRAAGVEPLVIARKLAADPAINSDGVNYPQGYGAGRFAEGRTPPSDKQLIIRVCQDLAEAIKIRRDEASETIEEIRQLEGIRLDSLQVVAFRQAMNGDFYAMDRVIKIMERRAKLFGVDAPTQLAGSGTIIVEVNPDLLPKITGD